MVFAIPVFSTHINLVTQEEIARPYIIVQLILLLTVQYNCYCQIQIAIHVS